jgi:hypothetical protein
MFRFLTRQPTPVAFAESLVLLFAIGWLDLAALAKSAVVSIWA